MRRTFLLLAGAAACLLVIVLAPTSGRAGESAFIPPHRYRIGILEAGPNWVHDKMLAAVHAGLRTRGWDRWIEFPANAHRIGSWSADGRATTAKLAAELMARQDLDCIIAMGTEAALALLAANNGKTPVVGMTLSDPVAAGVVKSDKDSGVSNLTTCVIPNQWISMLRLFYDVIRFKKLGIMYQDTPAGRTYSNVDDARDIAREQGFSLQEYSRLGGDANTNQCLDGIKWLTDHGVDAFYIPDIPCFDWSINDPKPLFTYLTKHNIATFARTGLPLVQLGALMGAFTMDMTALGEFHAGQIAAILDGANPRGLNMLMNDKLGMALNLETAIKEGLDFQADVLVSADVIVAHSIDVETLRKWY